MVSLTTVCSTSGCLSHEMVRWLAVTGEQLCATGIDIHYVPGASNARAPFVGLGMNECGPGASSPDTGWGGWCSPTSGIESKTSFDTSAMYMASGHLLSPNKEHVYMFSSGQPFTHGHCTV